MTTDSFEKILNRDIHPKEFDFNWENNFKIKGSYNIYNVWGNNEVDQSNVSTVLRNLEVLKNKLNQN